MPSATYDMPTPVVEAQLLASLRDEVGEALALSAREPVVPEKVAALVREMPGRLGLEDPLRAFAGIDPYQVEALLAGMAQAGVALLEEDPARARRATRVALERMRQALRDLTEEAPVAATADPKDTARWLLGVLEAPQAEVAELLGVGARTLQRWVSPADPAAPGGPEAARLRTVAALAAQLRHALTGPGVLAWFTRAHPALGGAAPLELLEDPHRQGELLRTAAGLRVTQAT